MSRGLSNLAKIWVKRTASRKLSDKPKMVISSYNIIYYILTEIYNYHVVDGKKY